MSPDDESRVENSIEFLMDYTDTLRRHVERLETQLAAVEERIAKLEARVDNDTHEQNW